MSSRLARVLDLPVLLRVINGLDTSPTRWGGIDRAISRAAVVNQSWIALAPPKRSPMQPKTWIRISSSTSKKDNAHSLCNVARNSVYVLLRDITSGNQLFRYLILGSNESHTWTGQYQADLSKYTYRTRLSSPSA